MAAYERQFYADNLARSRPTSGSDQSFNTTKTSGSKFWVGLREKFHISRTKSSTSINTVSSNNSKTIDRLSQQSQAAAGVPDDKENAAIVYPSREDVMENYKSLVDAGFFSSHAIHSTRHQRPAVRNDHPLPSPPPPARDAPQVPFSQLVAQKQRQIRLQNQIPNISAAPALSSNFISIPYSATLPSRTGDAPLTTYPRPDPRPPISLPKKYRRPQATITSMAPPTSPNRGTKRDMADMMAGTTESGMTTTGGGDSAEAGARKLVKKLRKSASRISADLSLRPATSAGSNGNNSPYGLTLPHGSSKDVRCAASSTSVDLVPRPPISSAGRARGMVRSLSNSFKRDGAKMAAVPSGGQAALAAKPEGATTTTTATSTALPRPNKLTKAPRSLSRRVSLRHSRSIISSSTAIDPADHLPPPVPLHRPQQHSIFADQEPLPRTSTTSTQGGDPMAIDSDAEPPTRNASLDVPPGGLSVPSFHYPQRQKVFPLTAVPDPNRGIPAVPAVPHLLAGRGHGKSGSFCFGTPAGMAGVVDLEKENFGVY